MPSPPEPCEKTRRIRRPASGAPRGEATLSDSAGVARAYARTLLRACDLGPSSSIEIPADSSQAPHPAVEWAQSGAMALTGTPGEAPRLPAGPLASAMRGAALVLEALTPQAVQARIDGPGLLGERAALFGLTRQGPRSCGGSARLLPTRKGFLAINLPREDDWRLVPAWLEDEFRLTDTSLVGAEASNWDRVEKSLATREAAPLVERGRLMGLAVAPVPKTPPSPTGFFRLSHDSERAPAPIGLLGSRRRLRVLDLSTLWAGPLAGSLLARAGVDVLKVESPTRPDGAREGPKTFFDLMNGGKQGCALDLRDARDRSIFERLLASADIVLESARPRALDQLGYAAAGWVEERPGRIWASITGYGRAHEWIAFGDDAAVAAGLAWSPLENERDPCFCADAIADPLTGLHAAVLLLAHLRAGRGGLLDLSLRDIAACAANAEHAGMLLPVERDQAGWRVLDDQNRIPVAAPRARAANRFAPPLRAPDDALIEDWTAPGC